MPPAAPRSAASDAHPLHGSDGAPARLARLIEIIAARSLLRPGQIKLASGATSSFYFDMKPTLFDPEGGALIAREMLDRARADGARAVGGLELGAVPIVAGIAQLSFLGDGPVVAGFFVRKTEKDHGTRKLIEGLPEGAIAGQRVALVEDVTTTGGSVMKAVEAARAAGAVVETVITVVDRLEGAAANLAREGLRLEAITRASDYHLGNGVRPSG